MCILSIFDTKLHNMMHKLSLSKYIILLGICICATSCSSKSETKWRYANALISTSRNPLPCIAPNPQEEKLFDTAATAIELGNDEPNSLDIGAQKLISDGLYHSANNEYQPVCIPAEILERVTQALKDRGGFGKGRLVEYQLTLASKLDHPDKNVIDAVAKSAFAKTPQQSEIFLDEDIRPYARAVLASFGHSADKYANSAFQQIEADTSMGTGAAQIAAAAGHPQALQKVTFLIDETLNKLQTGKAIPWSKRNRLYELAWAIAYSGDAGKPYVGSLYKIMSMRVESSAPPFGMVSAYPKQMCKALKYLEGKEALSQYAYCLDDKIPYEQ